jgi:hypothetical protein
MIFGTRRFGIECHIRNASGGHSIGDLWLWGDGLRIGDEISGVDLPLVLAALSGPLFIGGRRHNGFFDTLSKEQVAEFFTKLVFTEEKVACGLESVADSFRRYLLISAPDLEGFDTVFLILIGSRGGGDRLIWKYKGEPHVHEELLGAGEYDSIVLVCLDWVQQQTGYRSPQRAWLGLPHAGRDELRRGVVSQRPELTEAEQWQRVDQAAFEALAQYGDQDAARRSPLSADRR